MTKVSEWLCEQQPGKGPRAGKEGHLSMEVWGNTGNWTRRLSRQSMLLRRPYVPFAW